jgi:hypothetical protein
MAIVLRVARGATLSAAKLAADGWIELPSAASDRLFRHPEVTTEGEIRRRLRSANVDSRDVYVDNVDADFTAENEDLS